MTATFDVQIAQWVAQAKGRAREFCVEFIQDLNEEVVRATPVKTGFLRASWYGSLGTPSAAAGGGSVAQMNLVAATIVPGEVYFAMNGAAYAAFVEYGTVKMAPRAFVRGTVARADDIADAAARRVAALP